MDNDILIDQARQLYSKLLTKQVSPLVTNEIGLERLDRLIICAYCRYQRRLNRCAVCYQVRSYDCIREPGKKIIPCERRAPRRPIQNEEQKKFAVTQSFSDSGVFTP